MPHRPARARATAPAHRRAGAEPPGRHARAPPVRARRAPRSAARRWHRPRRPGDSRTPASRPAPRPRASERRSRETVTCRLRVASAGGASGQSASAAASAATGCGARTASRHNSARCRPAGTRSTSPSERGSSGPRIAISRPMPNSTLTASMADAAPNRARLRRIRNRLRPARPRHLSEVKLRSQMPVAGFCTPRTSAEEMAGTYAHMYGTVGASESTLWFTRAHAFARSAGRVTSRARAIIALSSGSSSSDTFAFLVGPRRSPLKVGSSRVCGIGEVPRPPRVRADVDLGVAHAAELREDRLGPQQLQPRLESESLQLRLDALRHLRFGRRGDADHEHRLIAAVAPVRMARGAEVAGGEASVAVRVAEPSRSPKPCCAAALLETRRAGRDVVLGDRADRLAAELQAQRRAVHSGDDRLAHVHVVERRPARVHRDLGPAAARDGGDLRSIVLQHPFQHGRRRCEVAGDHPVAAQDAAGDDRRVVVAPAHVEPVGERRPEVSGACVVWIADDRDPPSRLVSRERSRRRRSRSCTGR